MQQLEKINHWYKENEKKTFEDLFSFLAFKSISTDSKFKDDCDQCVDWLVNYLRALHFNVDVLKTRVNPVILAEKMIDPSLPTTLIYHHYDVQPVDPLHLWESDPFKPDIRQGNIFARGAIDNKGQCFYSLVAIKALLENSFLNCNLKLCIEGNEENGSAGLLELLEKDTSKFACDNFLVVDCGIPGDDIPAIGLGIRGIATMEVQVKTSAGDLHSGEHGGLACNPNQILAKALASMWDDEGNIVVKDFYEDMQLLTKQELAQLDLEFNEEEYKKQYGLNKLCKSKDMAARQSNWLMPTLEINGLCGGYFGEGFKTVIPASAIAKISCRLVPNQDPIKVMNAVKKHLRDHIDKQIEITFIQHGSGSAMRLPFNSKLAQISKKAYEEVFGKPCRLTLTGGSIPIIASLAKYTGGEVVFLGVGLGSDNMHAPNEHFSVKRFKQGFQVMTQILMKLSSYE